MKVIATDVNQSYDARSRIFRNLAAETGSVEAAVVEVAAVPEECIVHKRASEPARSLDSQQLAIEPYYVIENLVDYIKL